MQFTIAYYMLRQSILMLRHEIVWGSAYVIDLGIGAQLSASRHSYFTPDDRVPCIPTWDRMHMYTPTASYENAFRTRKVEYNTSI
jgi:hypothetical protein